MATCLHNKPIKENENGDSVTIKNIEQTVIIALDASEQAEASVKWYLDHAHRSDNRLIFVHCIELPEMKMDQARSMHMSPGVLATMWKEAENKTRLLEDKMKQLLKIHGISGILRTSTGKPGEIICRIAEEEQAVLIVTGTRGMGKPYDSGSVSDYLVNHAHCPVTVCRTGPPPSRQRVGSDAGQRKSRHTSGESIKNFVSSVFHGNRPSSRTQSIASDTEWFVLMPYPCYYIP